MSKIVFRYFFDFLDGQMQWLNRMAEQGYRLKKCGRLIYIFDVCSPGEYEYTVEYVGDKGYAEAKKYRQFLEDMSFRTFTKNININYSYGKIKWRPYAKGLGQISTSPGGYNKELLILEKRKDGTPFNLHTDLHDKLNLYRTVKRAYAWAVFIILGLIAMTFFPNISSISAAMMWLARTFMLTIAILFAIPAVKYSSLIIQLKRENRIYE
ncbi:MAG: DUF2812 domain-containing protein [Mobilitalea sp.]